MICRAASGSPWAHRIMARMPRIESRWSKSVVSCSRASRSAAAARNFAAKIVEEAAEPRCRSGCHSAGSSRAGRSGSPSSAIRPRRVPTLPSPASSPGSGKMVGRSFRLARPPRPAARLLAARARPWSKELQPLLPRRLVGNEQSWSVRFRCRRGRGAKGRRDRRTAPPRNDRRAKPRRPRCAGSGRPDGSAGESADRAGCSITSSESRFSRSAAWKLTSASLSKSIVMPRSFATRRTGSATRFKTRVGSARIERAANQLEFTRAARRLLGDDQDRLAVGTPERGRRHRPGRVKLARLAESWPRRSTISRLLLPTRRRM